MNKKIAIGIMSSLLLILLIQSTSTTAFSQGTIATPTSQIPNPTQVIDELVNKVSQLESEQRQQIEALKESNENYRFLLNGLGGILIIIVTAGGILQFLQFNREGKNDKTQSEREMKQDQIQDRAAKQVSDIMTVVRDTLQSRLDAEGQARKEATDAREKLDAVQKQAEAVGIFLKNFQITIQNARTAIEEIASRLAQTPRHDFRPISSALAGFAQQFENFNTEYKQLEENPPKFTSKVLYIRGIAAHYSNQPKIAKQYLLPVAENTQLEQDDTDNSYQRRRANAYYYLGLNDSNFGNIKTALDYLEQANKLDPSGNDFLTKIVTAEAYVMSSSDEFDKAEVLISQVEDGLRKKKERDSRLGGIYLRHQSRAALIHINMIILKHESNWQEDAEKLLLKIRNEDPSYYYATYTLAQLYSINKRKDDAKKLFIEAYETLERSSDLITTTEVRSLVLMRMVAGLCARHGLQNENKSDNHLDIADSLRDRLPSIDSQICTVFSVLSKFNERTETIHDHIEDIRAGEILLERRRRTNSS
ncbi:MAG: hypothetical protein JNM46_08845 [Anaerolineales bacterium]|nr:hypothetical protein [Anaerolineales bacterium]